MSVVPFSRARFSPADVAVFHEVALPRLADGRWAAIARSSGDWGDRLAVILPGQSVPTFTFARDRRGAYTLHFHDREGTVLIGTADTAAACLRVWSPPRRRARCRGVAWRGLGLECPPRADHR